MRSITAVSVLSLIALVTFGCSVMYGIPVTPDDAVCHAESVTEQSDTYEWLCYDTNGHLSRQTLEMHVDSSVKSDVLRQGTVLVKAPILLVDPEDPYVVKVADHILSVIEAAPITRSSPPPCVSSRKLSITPRTKTSTALTNTGPPPRRPFAITRGTARTPPFFLSPFWGPWVSTAFCWIIPATRLWAHTSILLKITCTARPPATLSFFPDNASTRGNPTSTFQASSLR